MNADADYRWIELNPDYHSRLQRFECAEQHDWLAPAGVDVVKKHGKYYYEYEWEVQSVIRSMTNWNKRSEWIDICVSTSTDHDGFERLYAFVWYGVIGGKKDDANGTYMIGYIARDNSLSGCKFGDKALEHALSVIEDNHRKTGREHVVGARIDPQNRHSMDLFARHGFDDYGPDPDATQYHRWLKIPDKDLSVANESHGDI